jgi:hypothetical protein
MDVSMRIDGAREASQSKALGFDKLLAEIQERELAAHK